MAVNSDLDDSLPPTYTPAVAGPSSTSYTSSDQLAPTDPQQPPPPPPPPAFPSSSAPSYHSRPQILLTPTSTSLSYLYKNIVRGDIHIKGLEPGYDGRSSIEYLGVRLTSASTLPNHPSIVAIASNWVPIVETSPNQRTSSKVTGSSNIPITSSSHPFSITLPSNKNDAPCCLHLDETDGGEVRWDVEVLLRYQTQFPGQANQTEEVRESHVVHLLPYEVLDSEVFPIGVGSSTSGNGFQGMIAINGAEVTSPDSNTKTSAIDIANAEAGPSRLPSAISTSAIPQIDSSAGTASTTDRNTINNVSDDATESVTISEFITDNSGFSVRLVLANSRVRNGQGLPIGVEIRQEGEKSVVVPRLRAVRRVKIEWWRCVEVGGQSASRPSGQKSGGNGDTERQDAVDEAGPSTAPSTIPTSRATYPGKFSSPTGLEPRQTLLYHSGKGCRFSSSNSIRLLFELPPVGNVLSSPSSGYATCGFLTQTTAYHSVRFLVRAIVGFAGSENEDVVLEDELVVDRPLWRDGEADLAEVEGLNDETTSQFSPGEVVGIGSGDYEDLPEDEDGRRTAYRLKGMDIVGETGTFRLIDQGSTCAGADGELPPFSAGLPKPPPFNSLESTPLAPPLAPMMGSSSVGQSVTAGDTGLPSFTESQLLQAQSTADSPARLASETASLSRASTPANPACHGPPTPPAPYLSGELATWVECDGYETFSEPPPPATASAGASGSMDIPNEQDNANRSSCNPAVARNAQERLRLVEALGLGEGTRVVDTEEDMPPSIDEPSLPALPNAIMPHHTPRARRYTSSSPSVAVFPDAPINHFAGSPPAFEAHTTDLPRSASLDAAPPPTFAASEAAEAQGIAATGPTHEPEASERDPPRSATSVDLPPSYTTGQHVPPQGEAPPGYAS